MNKFEESYTQNKYLFPDDGSRVDASGLSHQSNIKFNMTNLLNREGPRVATPFIAHARITVPNFARKPRTQQMNTRKMMNPINPMPIELTFEKS